MNVRSKGAHRRTRRAGVKTLALLVTSVAVVVLAGLGVSMGMRPAASTGPDTAVSAIVQIPDYYVAHMPTPTPTPTATPKTSPTVRPTHKAIPARVVAPPTAPKTSSPTIPSGKLSCAGLEALWDDAGGNPSHAFLAAEVAKAESGGRDIVSPPNTDGSVDEGYWQINSSHGIPDVLNPLTNARAAVSISSNGTDWNPWTTYRSGAYRGLC